MLAATTAFGKTVVAAWLIAQRGVNTLVLVHRRQLLDQWIERLATFLGLPVKSIGRIGGGRSRPTGMLDVALIQSLVRKGVVDDRVADYGHLIVDECHHLSAHSFEQVARQAKARYVAGLSATVARKDGHHPIIFMQCGPVRHRVDAKAQAAARPFEHYVLVRPTSFQPARAPESDRRVEFQALYEELIEDDARNRRICDDVIAAVRDGRSPLVLTERNDHLDRLSEDLRTAFDTWSCCAAAWARSSDRPSRSGWRPFPATRRGCSWPPAVHRRGIRRPPARHAVPHTAGFLARHHRAVRRPPAPAPRWQTRGARLRLRRPRRADAGADVRPALPRI